MRVIELYQDYRIDFAGEDSKHYRDGWVNIPCPFCTGNEGYHLGYNLDENYFSCWRCGGKFPEQVVSKVLSVSYKKAEEIIQEYGGTSKRKKEPPRVKVNLKPLKLPGGNLVLTKAHEKYLLSRNFDPDTLVKEWKLMGTGPMAMLDGINYSRRILAPIIWNNSLISFQTRDITGKHPKKYLACPQARENIEHQTILYGNQSKWGPRGICVEGITDVWRLGPKSFAVFGIDYTPLQIREIKKHFKDIVVLFDPDPQAQKQAIKLVKELEFRGVKARREVLNVDPGDLTQENADDLVKYLLK